MKGKFCLVVMLGLFLFTSPNQASNSTITSSFSNRPQSIKNQDSIKTLLRKEFELRVTGNPASETDLELAEFYKARNFHPAWISEDGWKKESTQAITVLGNADIEGLFSQNYIFASQLAQEFPGKVEHQMRAEIAFTRVVLDYINDLFGERLNPRRIRKELFLNPERVNAGKILYDLLEKHGDASGLGSLTLDKPQYQDLKKALARYRNAPPQEGLLPRIPDGNILKKGDHDKRVKLLRQRLSGFGYLDTVKTSSDEMDDEVTDALTKFQIDNNLEADGKAGPRTVAVLNKNTHDRINQILVAMERWRWLPRNMGNRYVFVNIPAFSLKGYENGRIVLEMPVIIGQNYRHTPVLSSAIDEVRFNPTWYVPRSIAIKDKLPKLKKHPESLSEKGYIIHDGNGNTMSPESVDWSQVDESNFIYSITQGPGTANALGKIRFNIENPFGIYLHSTPDKYLFKKAVRNFSSGCIRVGEPDLLAHFIFNRPQEWSLEKIHQSMEGTETRNVPVKTPVPVYITYFTTWVDEKEKIHFYDDIYNQDEAVLKELNKYKTAHTRAQNF